MKITLEADLPADEAMAKPVVYEHVALAGIVGRVDGIVGQVNPPFIYRHGNAWDVHQLLGQGRDRLLVHSLTELGVVPVEPAKEPAPSVVPVVRESEPAKEPTPDAPGD